MKKITFGILGLVSVISAASAVDTAQIKIACQNSDKTLWVERDQVCIPRNPCDNPNFSKYCNRDFANTQVGKGDDQILINVYAEKNGISCKAVPQESKLVGQDYVVCQGDDVMVFEFDDISDMNRTSGVSSIDVRRTLCELIGGGYSDMDDKADPLVCTGVSEYECNIPNKYIKGPVIEGGEKVTLFHYYEGKCLMYEIFGSFM